MNNSIRLKKLCVGVVVLCYHKQNNNNNIISHRSLSFSIDLFARNHGIHGKLLVDNRAETRPSRFVYAKLNRIANKISLQYLFDIFV